MTEVEGKISIWIKSGSFNHASDLYVQVMIDDNKVWRTDDKDGFSPDWDSTCVKHIKGDYEKVILKLMDEDTCTLLSSSHCVPRHPISIRALTSHCHPANSSPNFLVTRDDVIATAEFAIADLLDDGINDDEIPMCDADGNQVGTIAVNINFEAGDVNTFDLLGAMLHKSDD